MSGGKLTIELYQNVYMYLTFCLEPNKTQSHQYYHKIHTLPYREVEKDLVWQLVLKDENWMWYIDKMLLTYLI